MPRSYIALGSNLNDPRDQVTRAIKAISQFEHTTWVAASSLYETAPMGYETQDPFINAVVCIDTNLSPMMLLQACRNLEAQHHRERLIKNGPRTLDCDIILYGDDIVQTTELTIPHPGMLERDFVLVPLLEIAPDVTLPNGVQVASCLERLSQRYCLDLQVPSTLS